MSRNTKGRAGQRRSLPGTALEAGEVAGVPTIGYANKPEKDIKLAAAGAVVVVDSMQLIADDLA
ncbi:hypothetical protein ACPC54_13400 [Kitasatospora sp. NPDC094028]